MNIWAKSLLALPLLLLAFGESLSGSEADFKLDQARRSVYVVSSQNGKGSGVGVASHYILTNKHVVAPNPSLPFTISYGSVKTTGTYVVASKNVDLALIRTKDPINFVPIAASKPEQGAFILGYGKDNILDEVFAAWKLTNNQTRLELSQSVGPGDSGGGIFDRNGYLIGITRGVTVDGSGITIAIPWAWVKSFLTQCDKYGCKPDYRWPERDLKPSPIPENPKTPLPSPKPSPIQELQPGPELQEWLKELEKLLEETPKNSSGIVILYFTFRGANFSSDDLVSSLSTVHENIIIITLKPQDADVVDVPRIFLYPERKQIVGQKEVNSFLNSLKE